jgi:hypothetical protein
MHVPKVPQNTIRLPPHDCGNVCKDSRATPPITAENDQGADLRQLRTSINAGLTR